MDDCDINVRTGTVDLPGICRTADRKRIAFGGIQIERST